MAPPQHPSVLLPAHLLQLNARLTRELSSMQIKCNEYEKTIASQANEIRILRDRLNIFEQNKRKVDAKKPQVRSTGSSLGGNPPQNAAGSHSPVAATFRARSGTVPSSSHAPRPPPSRSASTNHQHVSVPNSLPPRISPVSSTAFSDRNIGNFPSQALQNSSRNSHSPVNDNVTNTIPQYQNWSIAFNREVKKELDVKLIHTFQYKRPVWCVRFSPEGRHLAVAYGKQTAIYDVATGRVTYELADLYEKRDLAINDLCFSPDGRYLATAYQERIYIWEISRRYVRNIFKHSKNRSLDFSSDGRLLVSATYDGTFRIWNIRDGTSRVFSQSREIYSVVVLDGLYVITGGLDGLIRMWSLRTGHLTETVKAHNDWITSLAFMTHGKGLVSGSRDGTLKCWDVGSLTSKYPRSVRRDKAMDKEGDSEDECPKNGIQPLQCFISHKKDVWTVAISPNGRWIVSGCQDNTVGILDAQTAETQCTLRARSGSVSSADVSPTGNYLAASCRDGQVGIWTYNKV